MDTSFNHHDNSTKCYYKNFVMLQCDLGLCIEDDDNDVNFYENCAATFYGAKCGSCHRSDSETCYNEKTGRRESTYHLDCWQAGYDYENMKFCGGTLTTFSFSSSSGDNNGDAGDVFVFIAAFFVTLVLGIVRAAGRQQNNNMRNRYEAAGVEMPVATTTGQQVGVSRASAERLSDDRPLAEYDPAEEDPERAGFHVDPRDTGENDREIEVTAIPLSSGAASEISAAAIAGEVVVAGALVTNGSVIFVSDDTEGADVQLVAAEIV